MIAKRAYIKMMTDSYSMFPWNPWPLIYYFSIENNQKSWKTKRQHPKKRRQPTRPSEIHSYFLRQPKLWIGENFGICHFRKIFNKCQHKTSIVYIDWAFNLKSTWLMNLVPDSKITATQKFVDKRNTISHIFTWALNDFWIVKRLSIGIPLKKPKNRTQLRLEFWSRPQHYNNETESKTKQYSQIFS